MKDQTLLAGTRSPAVSSADTGPTEALRAPMAAAVSRTAAKQLVARKKNHQHEKKKHEHIFYFLRACINDNQNVRIIRTFRILGYLNTPFDRFGLRNVKFTTFCQNESIGSFMRVAQTSAIVLAEGKFKSWNSLQTKTLEYAVVNTDPNFSNEKSQNMLHGQMCQTKEK